MKTYFQLTIRGISRLTEDQLNRALNLLTRKAHKVEHSLEENKISANYLNRNDACYAEQDIIPIIGFHPMEIEEIEMWEI